MERHFSHRYNRFFKDLENEYNSFDKKNCVDWLQIVHWPKGSFQEFHKDFESQDTVLTSITYLNDDFVGGETVFEDGIVIKPKKGRTLFLMVSTIHIRLI
jgi:hypothetical protein